MRTYKTFYFKLDNFTNMQELVVVLVWGVGISKRTWTLNGVISKEICFSNIPTITDRKMKKKKKKTWWHTCKNSVYYSHQQMKHVRELRSLSNSACFSYDTFGNTVCNPLLKLIDENVNDDKYDHRVAIARWYDEITNYEDMLGTLHWPVGQAMKHKAVLKFGPTT